MIHKSLYWRMQIFWYQKAFLSWHKLKTEDTNLPNMPFLRMKFLDWPHRRMAMYHASIWFCSWHKTVLCVSAILCSSPSAQVAISVWWRDQSWRKKGISATESRGRSLRWTECSVMPNLCASLWAHCIRTTPIASHFYRKR